MVGAHVTTSAAACQHAIGLWWAFSLKNEKQKNNIPSARDRLKLLFLMGQKKKNDKQNENKMQRHPSYHGNVPLAVVW